MGRCLGGDGVGVGPLRIGPFAFGRLCRREGCSVNPQAVKQLTACVCPPPYGRLPLSCSLDDLEPLGGAEAREGRRSFVPSASEHSSLLP